MDKVHLKTTEFLIKQKSPEVFTFTASTAAVDRDREVLLPEGCDPSRFLKNPVFLWGHNYRQFPIGKVVRVHIGRSVDIDVVFAETEEGQKAKYLYEEGFLNAVSVGFVPHKWYDVPSDQGVTTIEIEVRGKKRRIDLTKYEVRPRMIIAEWELLEVSAVTVPANPEALIRRSIESLAATHGISKDVVSQMAAPVTEQFQKIFKELKEQIEDFVKGAVPPHTTPIDFNSSWDKNRARAHLAQWASSDGSGDKDKIDFAKFARGFAWYDSEKKTNLTAYKLPHHDVIEGKFVAVWRGVVAAMAALLGARGGVNIPEADRKKVWNHLARHYRDADREPPPLERDYTQEELKAIEEGRWPLQDEGKKQEGQQTPAAPEKQLVELAELKDLLLEMQTVLETRLKIVEMLIEEKFDQLVNAKDSSKSDTQGIQDQHDLDPDEIIKRAWEITKKITV